MEDLTTPDAVRVVAARLLQWQRDMGVDAVVGAAAVDWMESVSDAGPRSPGQGYKIATPADEAAPAALSAGGATARSAPAGPKQSLADPRLSIVPKPSPRADTPSTETRGPAIAAGDLDALRAEIERSDGCALKKHATKLCFYRGAPTARVMIIGEAPGRDEDVAGTPFVGRGGQLLDRMLAAIGLSETDVHMTNAVYWRPPGNRQPTPQEALACRPFLDRQIALVAPQIVVLMGGVATASLLDSTVGIMRLRGKWTTLPRQAAAAPQEPTGVLPRVLPTLHPDYLLRSPAAKRQAWADLRLIRRALDGDD